MGGVVMEEAEVTTVGMMTAPERWELEAPERWQLEAELEATRVWWSACRSQHAFCREMMRAKARDGRREHPARQEQCRQARTHAL